SSDGSIIAGNYTFDPGLGDETRPFRWTSSTAAVSLGALYSGAASSDVNAMSADGSIVVGESNNASGQFPPFRWTSSTGIVALPFLAGGTQGQASGISADGSVIVGWSSASGGSQHAVKWIDGSNPIDLGFLPNNFVGASTLAAGVSGDGSIVY